MSQIIDFDRKGNLIRFYTGKNGQQWGDDWNDAPYDCNAGTVYDEYVDGHYDLYAPFDWEVLEPCDGVLNCRYSKEDMITRRTACLLLVPPRLLNGRLFISSFNEFVATDGAIKVYFGDDPQQVMEDIADEVGKSIDYEVF